MRLLTFNWHEAYICLLAKLGQRLDIVERLKGGSRVWFYETRPVPSNARIITEAAARRRLRARHYDAVVCHNVGDLHWVREWPVRKILVFHNKLSTEIALGQHTVDLEAYRSEVEDLIRTTPDVAVVFISDAKQRDWGLEGDVIPPGIDLADYGGYHGSDARVLRIGNFMRARDLMLGLSVQQRVVDGIPSTLLGLNDGEDDSRFTRSWDDLRECLRSHRCYLNTTVDPYEDGYNLSMLEAMATGTPVVSLANPSSPLVDGADGLVAREPEALRARVEALLADVDLARRLGAQGRLTVGRRFALSDFVRRWSRMLRAALRPVAAFAAVRGERPRSTRRASAPPGPRPSDRKRIVLAYVSYPATTARYLETSLRRHHEVVTVGPAIGPDIIRAWNLEGMREPVRPHNIPCDGNVDLEQVMRALPHRWRPDLMVWVETVPGFRPRNVPRLECPTAAYLIDSHLNLPMHCEWAPRFDWVFVAQRAYVDPLLAAGCLACDPAMHGRAWVDKRYDIGFVGSLTPHHAMRRRRIQRLQRRFAVHVERSFLRDMARTLSRSRIVFNDAVKEDLNMRVFEALATGSLLLTDRAQGSGLEEMFVDRQHLVYYDDEDTLETLADHYLRQTDERERIGEQGRAEVLRWHTYDHRAATLLDTVLGGAPERTQDPTEPAAVADPLVADGLELVRARKFEQAFERLRRVASHRDLSELEWAACHSAVAECLRETGDPDGATSRERAAIAALNPEQASALMALVSA